VIILEVWLYGPLARYGGATDRGSFALLEPRLPDGSRMRDLLDFLSLPSEERGITFVNGVLTAMPGVQPDLDHEFKDGDRVGIFHLKSMWPFQYRDRVALGPGLARRLARDAKHHRHDGSM
jgi:hypothetical protein